MDEFQDMITAQDSADQGVSEVSQIKAWSASRIDTYSSCHHRAKLAYIDKVPELPRPAPPRGKEHANDRGSRIHDQAEAYVIGKTDKIIPELMDFAYDFRCLRDLYKANPKSVVCERGWAFNDAWQPVAYNDYENIWLRVILDSIAFVNDAEAIAIDYKSGKRFGNEVKHAKQTQLYQLACFMRYPSLEKVTTELWYLDQDELVSMVYTRKQGMRFLRGFNERAIEMTEDTEFKPRPSAYSCRFCPYGPEETSNKWLNKTGDCPHGV